MNKEEINQEILDASISCKKFKNYDIEELDVIVDFNMNSNLDTFEIEQITDSRGHDRLDLELDVIDILEKRLKSIEKTVNNCLKNNRICSN